MRTWGYALLTLVLLQTTDAFAQRVPPNRAEALRTYLVSQGAMASRPTEPDVLSSAFVGAASVKACANLTILDTPASVTEETLSLFRVNFPRDPAAVCEGSPAPGACQAISRNCVAFGRALFCDVAYLERLRLLAEATYFTRFRRVARAFDGITEDYLEEVSSDVMREIAQYELALSSRSAALVNPGQSLKDIHHLNVCTALPATNLTHAAAAAVVIGHEISHLIEFACPADQTLTDVSGRLADTFSALTCRPSSRTEMVADVRSQTRIELASSIARGVDDRSLAMSSPPPPSCDPAVMTSLGISPSGRLAAESRLGSSNETLVGLTLSNVVEYEIAAFGTADAAMQAYSREADLRSRKASPADLQDHYLAHARTQVRAAGVSSSQHGLPAVRGAALLSGGGIPDVWRKAEEQRLPNNTMVRLSGLMVGQIAEANILDCRLPETEATSVGWRMFGTLAGPMLAAIDARKSASPSLRSVGKSVLLDRLERELLDKNLLAGYPNRFEVVTSARIPRQSAQVGYITNNSRDTIVLDRASSLMWEADSMFRSLKSHSEAYFHVSALNEAKYGGFDDWRLPTMEEAASLYETDAADAQVGFNINRLFGALESIWTADTDDPRHAWVALYTRGGKGFMHRELTIPGMVNNVRAVRTARSTP